MGNIIKILRETVPGFNCRIPRLIQLGDSLVDFVLQFGELILPCPEKDAVAAGIHLFKIIRQGLDAASFPAVPKQKRTKKQQPSRQKSCQYKKTHISTPMSQKIGPVITIVLQDIFLFRSCRSVCVFIQRCQNCLLRFRCMVQIVNDSLTDLSQHLGMLMAVIF